MNKHGFEGTNEFGSLSKGKEFQFWKDDVPLDIFWIYEGEYRGKKYHILASYLDQCDELPKKTCIWGYRHYKIMSIKFQGHKYYTIPKSTLVDMYGKDWKTPKKFGYAQGIEQGHYKGL